MCSKTTDNSNMANNNPFNLNIKVPTHVAKQQVSTFKLTEQKNIHPNVYDNNTHLARDRWCCKYCSFCNLENTTTCQNCSKTPDNNNYLSLPNRSSSLSKTSNFQYNTYSSEFRHNDVSILYC